MKKYLYPLILLAFLALLPLAVKSNYFLHLMILFLLWVVIGSAWNLLAGFTGQVSFGHAAFFGVGAYAAGLLFHHLQISPWWGMAIGGIVAVLIGLPFGAICFPLRGAYFALASLALGEGIRHVATIAEKFTGGMVGIMIMPTFTSKVPYYYIALGLAILSVASIQAIINSKPGYYFVSIREDQDAAASLGIDTTLYKNISLAISAFWTGMAGALYMNYMGFIDPHVVFSLHDYSVMAILVAIVGGVGNDLRAHHRSVHHGGLPGALPDGLLRPLRLPGEGDGILGLHFPVRRNPQGARARVRNPGHRGHPVPAQRRRRRLGEDQEERVPHQPSEIRRRSWRTSGWKNSSRNSAA